MIGVSAVIAFKNPERGTLFFTMFWLLYALSRIITIWANGPLGEFGNNWLKIELSFGLFALVLYLLHRNNK